MSLDAAFNLSATFFLTRVMCYENRFESYNQRCPSSACVHRKTMEKQCDGMQKHVLCENGHEDLHLNNSGFR